MKKILKSLLVLTLVIGVAIPTTGAYFSSTVIAADNVITAGTLLMAVDTARTDESGSTWNDHAWNVVRENADGTYTVGSPFVAWVNAAPGEEHSYYVGVRNRGTIDAEVRSMATGEWTIMPREDVGECSLASSDPTLVSVANVHQFASGNCEGEVGCENLYYSLTGLGWDHLAGLSANNAMPDADNYYYGNVGGNGQESGNHYLMGENEFAIYRVDVELSPDTDNCYQGATYNFDLTVQGQQDGGIW